MATSNFSNVDEYGFERSTNFDYQAYEDFMSEYLKILARRAQKWSEIVGQEKTLQRSAKMKRFVRKGIPSEYRAKVWLWMSGGEDLRVANPELYQNLLQGPHDQEICSVIKTDLPRTFPDNIFFNNVENQQNMLYNILVAFAHQNTNVGYCQGLNYIAGLLLLVTKDEECAFWLLKVLVEKILPDYYTSTMDGLLIDIDVLAELVRIKMPNIYQHVNNLGLPWVVITTKWFICLFAEVLPTETTLRIWDCLFYEGSKIIFRAALTLIKRNRQNLLDCQEFSELADCFKCITKNSIVLRCHDFMQSIFKVPGTLSSSSITKLRSTMAQTRNKKAQTNR